MATGTITGSFSGGTNSGRYSHYFTYKLVWESVADVANNRSTVTLNWYVHMGDNSTFYTNKSNAGWSKTVDGTETSGTQNFNYPNPITMAANSDLLYRTETLTINHGTNGKKSVAISGTIDLSGTNAGTGTLSGTMVLDDIPIKPSSVTASFNNYTSATVNFSGATGTSYEWQKLVNSGSWSASTSISSTSFSDTFVSGTTTVKYRVRAKAGNLYSAWTESAALTVPDPSLTSVTVTDGNSGAVYLGEMLEVTINGASGYVTGYNWQRSVNGGAWSSSSSTTDTTFYDEIPAGTTSIKYRIQAINPSRSSSWVESSALTITSNVRAAEATSGSIQTNRYNGTIGLILSWSASQSVANNTSTISWTLKSQGGSTSAWWNAAPITVVINGTTVLSITDRFKLYGGGAWSKTGTLTIPHNSDGSKSFSASISAAIYTMAVNCKASGTFTLKKIPRNPSAPTTFTITAGYGNYVGLGDTVTLNWSGASGNITGYELQYSRGNSGWKAWKTVTGSSTTDSFTATDINVNGAGCAVKYRIRAMNDSLPSDWKESNTLYITGGMDLKVSSAWKTGSVWINVNGTWKRAKRVYIKVNGTWQYSK